MNSLSLYNFIILIVVLCITGFFIILHPAYIHIAKILVIIAILYILLYRTRIITSIETFSVICIISITIHLSIHFIMIKYGIISVDNAVEGFSIKLDNFKNSDNTKNMSYNNRSKLKKRTGKYKKGKGKGKEAFEDSSNNYKLSSVKNDTIDYYNSFNKGIMKKKSQSTSESLEKFSFLKEKFFEIFE